MVQQESLELLLLGFLRAMKKAKHVQDMSEVNEDAFLDISLLVGINPETLLKFFHYFLFDGFPIVYSNYVHGSSFVVTAGMLDHLNNFASAGLFGNNEAQIKKRLREIRQRP